MNLKTIIAILGLIPQAISGIKLAVKSIKTWNWKRKKKNIQQADSPADLTDLVNK